MSSVRSGTGTVYVNNILNPDELELLDVEQHDVTVDTTPFARGGMRTCHVIRFGGGKGPMKVGKKYTGQETFLEDFLCSQAAHAVAVKFNELIKDVIKPPCRVKMVVPHQILHFEGANYFIEPYLQGQWRKHNDIFGNVYTNFIVAEAYSHFSYHYSNGKYMVLDIQGVDTYWTDPALVSPGREAGGITDTGESGIKGFFEKHNCNDLCKALQLPIMRGQPLDGRPLSGRVPSQKDVPSTPERALAARAAPNSNNRKEQKNSNQGTPLQPTTNISPKGSSSKKGRSDSQQNSKQTAAQLLNSMGKPYNRDRKRNASVQTNREPALVSNKALSKALGQYNLSVSSNPDKIELFALVTNLLNVLAKCDGNPGFTTSENHHTSSKSELKQSTSSHSQHRSNSSSRRQRNTGTDNNNSTSAEQNNKEKESEQTPASASANHSNNASPVNFGSAYSGNVRSRSGSLQQPQQQQPQQQQPQQQQQTPQQQSNTANTHTPMNNSNQSPLMQANALAQGRSAYSTSPDRRAYAAPQIPINKMYPRPMGPPHPATAMPGLSPSFGGMFVSGSMPPGRKSSWPTHR